MAGVITCNNHLLSNIKRQGRFLLLPFVQVLTAGLVVKERAAKESGLQSKDPVKTKCLDPKPHSSGFDSPVYPI